MENGSVAEGMTSMDASRMMIISSDGHATAQMDDYIPYIEPSFKEEFEEFCAVFREYGVYSSDPRQLQGRLDDYLVDDWVRTVVEPGHLEGRWNPSFRLTELDANGVAAEVIIPDFGLPFELGSPFVGVNPVTKKKLVRDRVHADVAKRAYNRWLVDFCQAAPERFAGMAVVEFLDIESTIQEIRWAKEAGLKGVMMPRFETELPLYDKAFDPVWSTLEDLEMVLNVHPAISSSWSGETSMVSLSSVPDPVCAIGLLQAALQFYSRQILDQMIQCGVLDRHPRLQVVFTELSSGWIPGKLLELDYTHKGSYRRDETSVVKLLPSEYFARQCYLGSSLLSRAEVGAREAIGIDKMMIGVDYPHHEGMWHPSPGVQNYLQATFGAEEVPEDEAGAMIGGNAANLFGFDVDKLRPIAERIGPRPGDILTPPTVDLYPRGDVHKPLGMTIAG